MVATVSPFVLAVLKYAFLALIYFFVFRAIRAVAIDISGRRQAGKAAPRQEKPRSRGQGKTPQIVVVKDESGKKLTTQKLSSPIQIGRADACHIKLDDTYASNFHARLYPQNGAWHVEDLGSTNGTYLNRQRVSGAVEVQAGDEVRVGKTTLELKR